MTNLFTIVVFAPISAASDVRKAIAEAGGGRIGNYDNCTFSSKGIGRFMPLENARPAIGSKNTLEEVEEERIETIVSEDVLKTVLKAIKKSHPYEEPAIHVLPALDYKEILGGENVSSSRT